MRVQVQDAHGLAKDISQAAASFESTALDGLFLLLHGNPANNQYSIWNIKQAFHMEEIPQWNVMD